MERLQRHLDGKRKQLMVSLVLFALFLVVCIGVEIAPPSDEDISFVIKITPFLLSFVAIPRNVLIKRPPTGETPEERDQIAYLLSETEQLELRLTYVRMGYIFGILVMFFALPRLGF